MVKSVCVFCASSEDLDDSFYTFASELGDKIGRLGLRMVHGAGGIGLMKRLSESAIVHGSDVVGVIPEMLNKPGIVWDRHTELIVTTDMKDRKDRMRELSDAFIALPGGFGTLEEIIEVITLKQLKYHSKPIVILNQDGFYDNLIKQFEVSYKLNFANPSYKKLFFVTDSINECMNYILNYKHKNIYDKYLKS